MPSLKHIHMYEVTTIGKRGYKVARCVLDGCSHYIDANLLIGKEAICPYCYEKFTVDKEMARRKTIHCRNCTRGLNTYEYRDRGVVYDEEDLEFLTDKDLELEYD